MQELATKDGFIEVHQPGELKALLTQAGTDGPFRILYTPKQGEEIQHFDAVCRLVAKRRRMIFAMDEVDKNQQPMWAPPALYELINYARHMEVAMIGSARRTAQVSKEYAYSLSEMCIFQVTEPGDLKYLASKIGTAATEQLPNLDKYAYLRWMQDGSFGVGKGWK